MIVVVGGVKGGVGKTTIATEVASRLNSQMITNERNAIIEQFILKDKYTILEDEDSLIESITFLQHQHGTKTNIVIDFAGKIDTRIIEAIIECDVYLTPILPGKLEIDKCREDISGLALYFFDLGKETESGGKIVEDLFNKIIIICNQYPNQEEAKITIQVLIEDLKSIIKEHTNYDVKSQIRYIVIPKSEGLRSGQRKGKTISEMREESSLARVNLSKIDAEFKKLIEFISICRT